MHTDKPAIPEDQRERAPSRASGRLKRSRWAAGIEYRLPHSLPRVVVHKICA